MTADVAIREAEYAALSQFLDPAAVDPAGLVIDGERGIGKTTLWLDGGDLARHRGWTVMTTQPVEAESVLAYASLADLLSGVDIGVYAHLPPPQRLALDRVLLRGDAAGSTTDFRAVAAAFLSVVELSAEAGPVLLAIDDLQWLDPSSRAAIAFASRRLSGPVRVLATLRTDRGDRTDGSWLTMSRPDAIRWVTLGPLSLGALQEVLSARLKRAVPRRALVRIHDISAGNPFYALELAREMTDQPAHDHISFPATLSELVRTRIGALAAPAQEALLAAACAGAPTIELIARSIGTTATHIVELLAEAECEGIIGFDGQRLRFGHPLLAAGVYAEATPPQRRAMHLRLADVVTEPELRARHLAMASTTGDPETVRALDAAARSAATRGAPGVAAELLDLAIGLGGDILARRVSAAEHHLRAANFAEAGTRLQQIIETSEPSRARASALYLLAEVRVAEDNYTDTVSFLVGALATDADDRVQRARVLILLSFVQLNRVEFEDAERNVDAAVQEATRLGNADILGLALGFRAMVRFVIGHGFDKTIMRRALDLEDPAANHPLSIRPCAQNALLLAWTGELAAADEALSAIRRASIDRGEEHELMTIDFHSVLFAIWRGDLSVAALLAEDAIDRARTLNRPHSMYAAMTMNATVLAYTGQSDAARRCIEEALMSAQQYGSPPTTRWTIAALGFLEVSLGNYATALQVLEPLLQFVDSAPMALEKVVALFVPDAAEALIHTGRWDDAERLLDRFEDDGRRLDRAWILACGGRCRAMLLAARGHIGEADSAVTRAMHEHDRLPMPFERARTQLLQGQLQRRQRRQTAAATAITEALTTFESLGTSLWADRARSELGRANIGPRSATMLTPSEQRVAELAASGMTNREVARELFISPKTVEGALARVYEKLGIRSRAELGRWMNQPSG